MTDRAKLDRTLRRYVQSCERWAQGIKSNKRAFMAQGWYRAAVAAWEQYYLSTNRA